MSAQQLIDWLGLYLGTIVFSLLAGLLPFLHAEIFLLAVGALVTSRWKLVVVALLSSLTQMLAKLLLYGSGRGVLRLKPLSSGQPGRLAEIQARIAGHSGSVYTLLFAAASLGVPPLYAFAIVAGMMRLDPLRFFLVGFAGRALRETVFVFCPQLVKHLFG
jgi:membrane protein YqaA with SNARE-associated domain